MRVITTLLLLLSTLADAQVGGRATYQFLNVVNSPRIAALGGHAIAIDHNDLEMAYFNPALLSKDNDKILSLNYTDYFTDINYGFVAYAKDYEKHGVFSLGAKYIHYGSFIHADETGEILGEFVVSETAGVLTWSQDYNESFRYGASLKLVYSNFFLYNSTGVLMDFGARYKKPGKKFVAALVIKNLGTQITTYSNDNFEPMPFEVQLGVSQELAHAPLRFSITAHNLQQPNIWFESPNNKSSTSVFLNDSSENKTPIGEAILRHFTFGTEILFSENFQLRFGYNHQRRQELVLKEGSKKGTNGFSFGFGLKIKRFSFDFARSIYSLAGATNHIGISVTFGEQLQKKEADKEEEK
ncbi:MAG: hypothetical protein ACJA0Q_000617 [Saprospiraceae bacterium]|jgi:hypothetical protein